MKRGAMWPIAMAGILACGVGANVWLIRIASADPSFAVEENYYQRALRWDDELAQRARNDSLGWYVQAALAPASGRGDTEVHVRLWDALGTPIVADTARVRALHVARAADVFDLELLPVEGGGYVARMPMMRHGLWELRFEIWRGADRFTAVRRLDAVVPGS